MRTARSGNAAAATGAVPRPGRAAMADAMTVRRRRPVEIIEVGADGQRFMVGLLFANAPVRQADGFWEPRP